MIRPFLVCFAAATLFASGCASTGLESLDVPALPLVSEKEKEVPTRVIPVWTDTVLHRGGKAVRGFGGRVIFYGAEENQPIEVDGALAVYAWDDTTGRGQETPDRKYVFRKDDFEKHYSASKVGHSYSFWLPWDSVGGETKHITLITRFVSAAGGEVTSSAAHVVLPGPMDPDGPPRPKQKISSATFDTVPSKKERQQLIQQLGFEEEASPTEKETTQATTIDLPLHLARGSSSAAGVEDLQSRRSLRVSDLGDVDLAEPLAPEPAESVPEPSRSASRFGRRQLPVRSSQSDRRSSSRERIQRDRSALQSRSQRTRQPNHVSVQQKIARDAAEAKARRAEAWGQYQSAGSGRD